MEGLKKILDVGQIRSADNYTIKNEPIGSLDLMERASNAFVRSIEDRLNPSESIAVVCGPGNNGGDGLAIARILQWKGFEVQPYLCYIGDSLSADCAANAQKMDNILELKRDALIPDFSKYDVIVDGIFGSGLSRKIKGWPTKIIDAVNSAQAKIYAIDIPSGMYCDSLPDGERIIKADLIVTFQRPKLSFFFPESSEYFDHFEVVDIGLDESYMQSQDSSNFVLDESIGCKLKKRKRYSHKGTYGHALIIAGARGKMGAAVLCGKGCLRSGVGLLTVHIPSSGLDIVQVAIPEAMCSIDPHDFHFSTLPELSKFNCIGIGPGLGVTIETKKALAELMKSAKLPLVIDADALNIISKDQTLIGLIPEHAILTPHPKEFERLVGTWYNSSERLIKQQDFSIRHKCIVVLKDAQTVITAPNGNTYFNTTGNPGMATGGSGDVLTGIITGLLAQKYDPLEAALIGVYYHGRAGDKAKEVRGEMGMIAGDLVEFLSF